MGAKAFPVGDAVSNDRLLEFLELLVRAKTVNDVWSLTRNYTADLGATHVSVKLGIDSDAPIFLWTVPSWTTELYFDSVYPEHDPRLAYCRNHTTPYFHGCEFWHAKDGVPQARRAYDETLIDVCARSLVSLPIHSIVSKERGIFSYAFDVRRSEFERLYELNCAAIHLAALGAYNRIADIMRDRGSPAVHLTDRERECLLWLGRGFQHDQIASRLNISRATVEFHLCNARRRLDARTREQALAKSIQLGLINP